MPKVWNKRDPNVPADAVYVGRPTKFGNPFSIGQLSPIDPALGLLDRAEVIRHFMALVAANPDFRTAIRQELRGKDLVCWCAPEACHADILLEIANGK